MHNTSIFRTILIDDEKKGISALKHLIEKYTPDLRIIAEFNRAPEAIETIETKRPDIVFLDINMPGMNGFELLEKLRWKNFYLIFTTAHQEYGLKALKNNAIDYLLKPISHKDLAESVHRIRKKIEADATSLRSDCNELLKSVQKSESRMLFHSISGVEFVAPEEIVYLESQSNYTKIRLANASDIVTRKTLKEFEIQICTPDSDFMRVHNSFIINLRKVSTYLKSSEEIILISAIRIPLSKARRDAFFHWLNIF